MAAREQTHASPNGDRFTTGGSPTPGASLAPSPAMLPAAGETASTAVAAQAKAMVEARYLMALGRPRSWMEVRQRLLETCRRPGFAAVARYAKPIGDRKKIEGPSIRFAEEALRAMTNVLVEAVIVFDDDEKRIVRVNVTDLEANLSYPSDIVLSKTVERSKLREGQKAIRARTNASGNMVYLVEATEDDLLVKQNAQQSKTIRTGALRILPADIQEEAMEVVLDTLRKEDARDPKESAKRIADLFYRHGVSASELEAFLGHKLEMITSAEVSLLRAIYTALKEGEATWADVMEEKNRVGEGRAAGDGAAASTQRGTAGLRERVKARGGEQPSEQGSPQPSSEPWDGSAGEGAAATA